MTLDQYGLIAVVDDDVSMLNALRRLLVARRYQVQTFQSAEELLQSPELDQFACVVSDIDLRDGMSGLDLGERMRARGHGARVIFVTGAADDIVRGRALALGCAAFFEKPFSSEKFIESVAKAVTGTK